VSAPRGKDVVRAVIDFRDQAIPVAANVEYDALADEAGMYVALTS
jgi:hypothetical protein